MKETKFKVIEMMVKLFRILSNQKRIEILSVLKDMCRTPSELAGILKMNKNTLMKHLKKLESAKLVKVIGEKDGEKLYDLYSVRIYNLFEKARTIFPKEPVEVSKGVLLDLRGELCPVPLIETERNLKKLNKGEILEIWLDYPLSKERILSRYKDKMIALKEEKDFWRIFIKV